MPFHAPAGGAAGLTREGGNTTEGTSTSTSAANLLTASSLTIAAGEPFDLRGVARKTSGASSVAGLGLTVNATTVIEADTTVAASLYSASAGNRAESGTFLLHGYPGQTNYIFASGVILYSNEGTAVTGVGTGAVTPAVDEANWPVAAITTLVIRAITASASQTVAADEMHVYSLAVS
jgi:hypothetical protein